MKLVHVYSGGAAERAGLAAGDVLVAVDGLKASADTLRTALERYAPGDRLRVHAFRRDELAERTVTLAAPAQDTCVLRLREDASGEAIARRAAWLGA
jgi:predicted metalloprotease with PDZ domain